MPKFRIREVREAKNLNLGKIAQAAEMSTEYLRSLEDGRRNNPSFNALYRLAKAMGCKVDDFVDDESRLKQCAS